jgi:hypothetical protein
VAGAAEWLLYAFPCQIFEARAVVADRTAANRDVSADWWAGVVRYVFVGEMLMAALEELSVFRVGGSERLSFGFHRAGFRVTIGWRKDCEPGGA